MGTCAIPRWQKTTPRLPQASLAAERAAPVPPAASIMPQGGFAQPGFSQPLLSYAAPPSLVATAAR